MNRPRSSEVWLEAFAAQATRKMFLQCRKFARKWVRHYGLARDRSYAADLVQNAFITPLNTKLGQNCFALAGSSDAEVGVSFSSACAEAASGGKLETVPPAGLLSAPDSRSKPLLKGAGPKTTT